MRIFLTSPSLLVFCVLIGEKEERRERRIYPYRLVVSRRCFSSATFFTRGNWICGSFVASFMIMSDYNHSITAAIRCFAFTKSVTLLRY